MINFDDFTNENVKEHNSNWPQISDYPYRILIIEGSGSGKTNLLFNLITQQMVIDKIYPYEAKISMFNWKTRKYWHKAFEWF